MMSEVLTSRLGGKKLKLSSLIGLSREKQKARLLIRACRRSGETFPHTLLYGIGGTGKTEFARRVGYELGYHFVETHAAAFKKREPLFATLIQHSKEAQRAGHPLLFFIDEIHRLRTILQEALYQALKEWWIPTLEGNIRIPAFTLFGATTRFDMLDSNSFVTRFGNVWEIQRYELQEMAAIVANELSKQKLRFSAEVSYDIAKRCLGVPRNAVNLANKVRITALSEGAEYVTLDHARRTFELEEIDALGLHPVHHRYLEILARSVVDGHHAPLGVGPIAAKMRQPEDVIQGSVEPILLELDFVAPSPRGRVLTSSGAEYFQKVRESS
jgi:Holliday junction DNA helicase RuvB